MKLVRDMVEKIHSERKRLSIPVRQPLNEVKIDSPDINMGSELVDILKDEVNIKKVTFRKEKNISVKLDTKITPELKEEAKARELIREIQKERKNQKLTLQDKVEVYNLWVPKNKDILESIKRKTFSSGIIKGQFKVKKI